MTAGEAALAPTIHASAVLVGERAVLIRGRSGSGKSRLAFELILAGRAGQLPPTVLVGDDRVHLEPAGARLTVRPAAAIAGLLEIRGLGLRRCEFATQAQIGLVVDLDAADAERLPQPEALQTELCGVTLPRIPVAAGFAALPLVVAALTTSEGSGREGHEDCPKGFGNHINRSIVPE